MVDAPRVQLLMNAASVTPAAPIVRTVALIISKRVKHLLLVRIDPFRDTSSQCECEREHV